MKIAPSLICICVLLATLPLIHAQEVPPLPQLDSQLQQRLTTYLNEHGEFPDNYILDKFEYHDVVILGEQHRARQDPLLVQSMIPLLPSAGVYILCTEFARREDQPLIDSLLTGSEYDEKLAEEIAMRQFVHWGYVEYVDIFKAAWQYNHDRQQGERAFRILGLNNSPEWWHIETQEQRDDPEFRRKVWHGESEKDWADCLLREVIEKNEKALVYCGINHGITEYRQPVVVDGKFVRFVEDRFGRYLFNAIGKRVITIYLHNSWVNAEGWSAPSVRPADGYIDALMKEIGPDAYPVGFDTKGTPFGDLPGATSLYSFGYEDFTLADFCDGYIYQMPFSEFVPITCIDGYYSSENIDFARRNALNPWFRDQPIEEFESSCEETRQENLDRWGKLR